MSRILLNTDSAGYLKDEDSGVIINTNYDEYESYVKQKTQYKEYLKTKQDIATLQTEMAELKRLLLEKINNG